MKRRHADLQQHIAQLLAEPAYAGHPLRDALESLWQHTHDQLSRIERITHLSDGFQSMAREREQDISARFDRELRRLERIVRISDHYQDVMRDLNTALKEASSRDALTSLLNRRALMEGLKEETERARRHGRSYVLAMLDVDHFKQINDCYGHDAGDRTLLALADLLRQRMRQYDWCGRWGGDEFLLLLPEADIVGAVSMLERIVQHVHALRIPAGTEQLAFTVSVGLAQYMPGEKHSETLARADQALYQAKQDGRDRVACLPAIDVAGPEGAAGSALYASGVADGA